MQDQPERFKLGESGYMGLNIFDGVSNEELTRELNFPNSVKTFKEMSYHPAINAPLTLYQTLISKVNWRFIPPADATEDEKAKAETIQSMMQDMEGTWREFISDVLSAQLYGFSIHEKVFRKRLKSNGSKFNDGIIGWKKLPIRSQDTIEKFIFDETGNEVIGVKQDISRVGSNVGRYTKRKELTVVLPKSKFLHFRFGKHRGDPFGKSALRDAYMPWRYLSIIEEIESHGVAKDLSGLPILMIPPQYLSEDATPAQKSIRAYYEQSMRNLQMNQQSAMILPMAYDPETRQPLFKLELLSLDGKKAMDTDKIKIYYKNLIFTVLVADVLQMGQTSTGSFALGQVKNSLTGSYAESLLQSIVDVLNHDLVKQTYELNGWDTSRMGQFDFEGLESDDLETYSKAAQRLGATGLIPKTLDVINHNLRAMGIDPLPSDTTEEELQAMLTPQTTRSGDSFNTATGGLNGTSDSVATNDTSSLNRENAA